MAFSDKIAVPSLLSPNPQEPLCMAVYRLEGQLLRSYSGGESVAVCSSMEILSPKDFYRQAGATGSKSRHNHSVSKNIRKERRSLPSPLNRRNNAPEVAGCLARRAGGPQLEHAKNQRFPPALPFRFTLLVFGSTCRCRETWIKRARSVYQYCGLTF
jgi:hypothetical protein